MTRIAFATDIHMSPRIYAWVSRAAKTQDIVLLGGDFAGLPSEGLTMTERLVSMAIKAGNIVMVAGNHDFPIYMEERGILHGTTTQITGLTIGGIGGSLPVWGPFEVSESEYELLLKKIGPVDILLSHQPPYNTECDVLMKGGFHEQHIGSEVIRRYIEETQPKLVLCGHIHESVGVDSIGKTTIINPGDFASGNWLEVRLFVGSERAMEIKFRRLRPLSAAGYT